MLASLLLSCLFILTSVLAHTQDEWALQCPQPGFGPFNDAAQCGVGSACVVSDLGTIVRTTDYGQTWTRTVLGVDWDLVSVKFFKNGKGVCITRNGGAFFTKDAGVKWSANLPGADSPRQLNDVSFIDSTTWVGVGDGGVVWLTTNSGVNWRQRVSSATTKLKGVACPDMNTGIAVGEGSTILRSSGGLSEWLNVLDDSLTTLEDVVFVDSKRAIAVGYREGGVIYTSTDAGKTWTYQTLPSVPKLTGIVFYNTLQGSIVGVNGTVLTTADGGDTWKVQSIGVPRTSDSLTGILYFDIQHQLTFGYDNLLATSDGGVVWSDCIKAPATSHLNRITFVDSDHGIAVGSSGGIVSTTNAGGTWISHQSGINSDLLDVSMADVKHGAAVGARGAIVTTDDGGETWSPIPSPTASALNGVACVAPSVLTVIGDSGKIYRTVNNGLTWTQQRIGSTQKPFDMTRYKCTSVSFSGLRHGFVVLVVSPATKYDSSLVIHTTNGGDDWSITNPDASNLRSITAADTLVAMAVGIGGVAGLTRDGGVSWSSLYLGSRDVWYQVAFRDTASYAILGSDGIVWEQEAGKNYASLQKISNAGLKSISTAGKHAYTVAGSFTAGVIYRSSDGFIPTDVETLPSLSPPRSDLQCYPNPAQDHVTIRLEGEHVGPIRVELVDVLGTSISMLCESQCSGGRCECTVSTNTLAGGMYLLRVTDLGEMQGGTLFQTATVIVAP